MQMHQSNWLSYSYTIIALVYEWLEVVYKMAVSFTIFSDHMSLVLL